jgi:hypothetical protein
MRPTFSEELHMSYLSTGEEDVSAFLGSGGTGSCGGEDR